VVARDGTVCATKFRCRNRTRACEMGLPRLGCLRGFVDADRRRGAVYLGAWCCAGSTSGYRSKPVEVETERECRQREPAARNAAASISGCTMVSVRTGGAGPTWRSGTRSPDAVEIEFSPKGTGRLEGIVDAYVQCTHSDGVRFLVSDPVLAARLTKLVDCEVRRAGRDVRRAPQAGHRCHSVERWHGCAAPGCQRRHRASPSGRRLNGAAAPRPARPFCRDERRQGGEQSPGYRGRRVTGLERAPRPSAIPRLGLSRAHEAPGQRRPCAGAAISRHQPPRNAKSP